MRGGGEIISMVFIGLGCKTWTAQIFGLSLEIMRFQFWINCYSVGDIEIEISLKFCEISLRFHQNDLNVTKISMKFYKTFQLTFLKLFNITQFDEISVSKF